MNSKQQGTFVDDITFNTNKIALKENELVRLEQDLKNYSNFTEVKYHEYYIDKRVQVRSATGVLTQCGQCDNKCHNPCSLTFGDLEGCCAFTDKRCNQCGHPFQYHHHSEYYWETQKEKKNRNFYSH